MKKPKPPYLIARLEAWLSNEGKPTGGRFVSHVEYDGNFGTTAFRVALSEWNQDNQQKAEYIGYGGNHLGGLAEALTMAVDEATAVPTRKPPGRATRHQRESHVRS